MSGVSIVLTGMKQLGKNVVGISNELDKQLAMAVRKGAIRIQKRAVERIQQGPKSGQVYEKTKPKRTHQASAPGESPASDTGRLASSIKVATDEHDDAKAFVFTTRAYGRHLEFGTRKSAGHAGIAARPWLFVSFEEERPRINVDIAAAYSLSLKKSSKD